MLVLQVFNGRAFININLNLKKNNQNMDMVVGFKWNIISLYKFVKKCLMFKIKYALFMIIRPYNKVNIFFKYYQ